MEKRNEIPSSSEFEEIYEAVIAQPVDGSNVYKARSIIEKYVVAHPEKAAMYFQGTPVAGIAEDVLRESGQSHLAKELAMGMVELTADNRWRGTVTDRVGSLSGRTYVGRNDVSHVNRSPICADIIYNGAGE